MPNKSTQKSEKSGKSLSALSKRTGKQGVKKSGEHKQAGKRSSSHEEGLE